jgi:pentapeptide MXKDX repeat protein
MLKTEARVCQKAACDHFGVGTQTFAIPNNDLGFSAPVTLFLAENPIPRAQAVTRNSNQYSGDLMKKMLCKLMMACCLALPVTAFAQSGDSMSQDNMKHDDMKQDQMNKDNNGKKAKKAKKAKKDSMKKDDMKKEDGMKHDDMKKDDGMKQDDGMKK